GASTARRGSIVVCCARISDEWGRSCSARSRCPRALARSARPISSGVSATSPTASSGCLFTRRRKSVSLRPVSSISGSVAAQIERVLGAVRLLRGHLRQQADSLVQAMIRDSQPTLHPDRLGRLRLEAPPFVAQLSRCPAVVVDEVEAGQPAV